METTINHNYRIVENDDVAIVTKRKKGSRLRLQVELFDNTILEKLEEFEAKRDCNEEKNLFTKFIEKLK